MKRLFILLSVLVLSACASNERMFDIVPAKLIQRVQPIYPVEAKELGLEGYVKLRFTLSAQGNVVNPVVTESEPKIVFDFAALDAVKQLKYTPRIVNGQPQAIQGVTYRYYFDLNDK